MYVNIILYILYVATYVIKNLRRTMLVHVHVSVLSAVHVHVFH